jgi:FkbM family methyltransferase
VWESANWVKSIAKRILPVAVQTRLRTRYLVRRVLSDKEYVEPEMAVLKSLVSPGQTAIDIGANVGFYTKLLSQLVEPSGHVYAFEPILENFRILEGVVKGGDLSNVETILAAVGQEPGEHEMVIPDRSDFTGFYQARLADGETVGQKQRVRVTSLDKLWNEKKLPAPDFIKCDAEGSELGILQGGVELIKNSHPSLLVEVQRKTGTEVFDFLHKLGYKSYVLSGGFAEVSQFDSKFWNYFFFYRAEALKTVNGTELIELRNLV